MSPANLTTIPSLMEKGIAAFGTESAFIDWLGKENFFFDTRKPVEFLKDANKIKFIEDRLVAMTFGDNV